MAHQAILAATAAVAARPAGSGVVSDDVSSETDLPTEPILSPDIPSLPPPTSASRARGEESSRMALPWTEQASENDPLLASGVNGKRKKKPFYRARPLWIVPFAIIASITRGMTIAPRVEVFTQLSCNALHGRPIDYNHTRSHSDNSQTLSTFSPNYKTLSLSTYTTYKLTESNDDDNDGWGDPEDPTHLPTRRCLQDPAVQAGAARLQMIMTTTMGTLSALTTGWWGHFGERHGRTRVLAASTIGWLLTDLMFILVSLPGSPLAAHGHKLLIISPIVEGLLGGWSTLQGATSAYISDCTSDGSRAHIFSRFTGVFFLGFAAGPMVGAFILTHPGVVPFFASASRSVTPVFCAAVFLSFTNFLLALFVFPESLGQEQRKAHKEAEEHAKAVALAEAQAQGLKKPKGGVLTIIKGLFVPLLVFAPKKRSYGRDWNMTLLAIALFGYLLSSGIYQLKYLYAEHVFSWEAEQLSYYVTFMGAARALCLLFGLPLIISTFKPKPKPKPNPQQATVPGKKKPRPTPAQLANEMKFDIRLARGSYMIDILSHTLVALSSTAGTSAAQAAFVGFTVLSSFGAGVVPAVQSLALCVIQADATEEEAFNQVSQSQDQVGADNGATSTESNTQKTAKPIGQGTGTLFGAFAVLQATGQMILGPVLFGMVYSSTVARFPKGIFILAASILVISLSLLMFVHPHQIKVVEQQKQLRQRQKKGRDYWADAEIERGRSRVSKDLSGGSSSGNSWPSIPSGSGSSSYSGRYSSTVVQPITSGSGQLRAEQDK